MLLNREENYNSVYNQLNDWRKLVYDQKPKDDVWVELEFLPGYQFKNPRLAFDETHQSTDIDKVVFNFTFDNWMKID